MCTINGMTFRAPPCISQLVIQFHSSYRRHFIYYNKLSQLFQFSKVYFTRTLFGTWFYFRHLVKVKYKIHPIESIDKTSTYPRAFSLATAITVQLSCGYVRVPLMCVSLKDITSIMLKSNYCIWPLYILYSGESKTI